MKRDEIHSFVRGYFRRTRREKISRWVEKFGEAIIRLSVAIRNPTCRCNICVRNLSGILDSWADADMNLMYERDKPWADGTCIGESR